MRGSAYLNVDFALPGEPASVACRDSVANISPNKIFKSKFYWLFHQNVINCNLHFFSIFYSSILKESLTLKTDLQCPEAENWLYAAGNIFTSGQK